MSMTKTELKETDKNTIIAVIISIIGCGIMFFVLPFWRILQEIFGFWVAIGTLIFCFVFGVGFSINNFNKQSTFRKLADK